MAELEQARPCLGPDPNSRRSLAVGPHALAGSAGLAQPELLARQQAAWDSFGGGIYTKPFLYDFKHCKSKAPNVRCTNPFTKGPGVHFVDLLRRKSSGRLQGVARQRRGKGSRVPSDRGHSMACHRVRSRRVSLPEPCPMETCAFTRHCKPRSNGIQPNSDGDGLQPMQSYRVIRCYELYSSLTSYVRP